MGTWTTRNSANVKYFVASRCHACPLRICVPNLGFCVRVDGGCSSLRQLCTHFCQKGGGRVPWPRHTINTYTHIQGHGLANPVPSSLTTISANVQACNRDRILSAELILSGPKYDAKTLQVQDSAEAYSRESVW